jgi:hypothetical protein
MRREAVEASSHGLGNPAAGTILPAGHNPSLIFFKGSRNFCERRAFVRRHKEDQETAAGWAKEGGVNAAASVGTVARRVHGPAGA